MESEVALPHPHIPEEKLRLTEGRGKGGPGHVSGLWQRLLEPEPLISVAGFLAGNEELWVGF